MSYLCPHFAEAEDASRAHALQGFFASTDVFPTLLSELRLVISIFSTLSAYTLLTLTLHSPTLLLTKIIPPKSIYCCVD